MKKLTIAIPTYKRPDIVAKLIHNFFEEKINDYAEILLIDDGPSEDLKDKLSEVIDKIKFIAHEENKGYCNTFCELFENCHTEYILITADDDKIIPEGIEEINEFLSENSFDFLSTRWLSNGKTYRGKNECIPITLLEVTDASNHAPGLIYKVESVIPLLPFLKERMRKNCSATFFYPQVVVLYLLLLQEKKCYWHPNASVEEGNRCATNLLSIDGNSYASVFNRWKEYLDFLDLFDNFLKINLSKQSKKNIQALKILYQQTAYERIDSAICLNHKNIYMDWVVDSIFYNIKRPSVIFRCIFIFLKNRIKCKSTLKMV